MKHVLLMGLLCAMGQTFCAQTDNGRLSVTEGVSDWCNVLRVKIEKPEKSITFQCVRHLSASARAKCGEYQCFHLIKKADGSCKIVTIYNTHGEAEKMFNKLKQQVECEQAGLQLMKVVDALSYDPEKIGHPVPEQVDPIIAHAAKLLAFSQCKESDTLSISQGCEKRLLFKPEPGMHI